MPAEYEIYKSSDGKYFWRFKAGNSQILAFSETYTAKQSCFNAIDTVKKEAKDAPIHDMTGE